MPRRRELAPQKIPGNALPPRMTPKKTDIAQWPNTQNGFVKCTGSQVFRAASIGPILGERNGERSRPAQLDHAESRTLPATSRE